MDSWPALFVEQAGANTADTVAVIAEFLPSGFLTRDSLTERGGGFRAVVM
jgi:hypothetical protein